MIHLSLACLTSPQGFLASLGMTKGRAPSLCHSELRAAERGIPEAREHDGRLKMRRLALRKPCTQPALNREAGMVNSRPLGVWCSGPTRCPVKAETAGSNPVIPAEPPGPRQAVVFRERSFIAALRSLDTTKSAVVLSAVLPAVKARSKIA